MHETAPFLSLLLITTLAAVVPLLSSRLRRFRIPIVVGEILIGILIGKSGLNLVTPDPVIKFLSEFGFVFLMFISGLEVDLSIIMGSTGGEKGEPFHRKPLFLALASFTATLTLAFSISLWLTRLGIVRNPFIVSLILSTTSLGIVVPVLKERRLTGTRYGQLLLLAALLADFITLLLLSITLGIIRRGVTLDLMLFLVLLAAFAVAVRMGLLVSGLPGAGKILEELSSATAQIQVRGALAFMVGWATLAYALGVEIILGAFLAGVILSVISEPGESTLREKLDALGFGFFIPIFFINVGAGFDLQALLSSGKALLLVPLLITAAYGVKLVPGFLFRLAFSWRESLAAGLLLSSRLSLIIAASALALELGAITEAVNAAVILVAIVTCTFSPSLFNRALPPREEVRREGVIVVGVNQLTGLLIERLIRDGEKVIALGCSPRDAESPYCRGVETIVGDPTAESTLEKAGADRAAALVSALPDPELSEKVCRLAIERFGIPVVVSRADDFATMERLRVLGVRTIQPALATAIALEGALRFPTAFDVLADQGDNVEIRETVMNNPRLNGLPLKELKLPGGVLVMGIRRGGDVIIPHGDTTLNLGDVVMMVGSPEALQSAKAMLEGPGF